MVTPKELPLDQAKLIILIIFDSLWVYHTLWRHTEKHCVKFSLLKRPGARDMIHFGCHVGSHIPNIGYFEVCEGIWGDMEVYTGM